jgi:hypothetical protein
MYNNYVDNPFDYGATELRRMSNMEYNAITDEEYAYFEEMYGHDNPLEEAIDALESILTNRGEKIW